MKGAEAMEGFITGRASKYEGWLELGISLPLTAYQAAPCLGLPLRWGMVRGIVVLGKNTQSRMTRMLQKGRGGALEIE